MRVAVIILNWNGRKYLEQFLPALIRFSQEDAEIIVADNASTDDSVAFLRSRYPSIRIISNPKNGGFASGYNQALRQVDADYYVLLNSDIEVTENWIPPVIALMEKDDQVAACQPKVRSYYEPKKFEYAGAAGGFLDQYGYPFCRGRLFQAIEEDHGQYDDVCEIFWATGACMFVRANVFRELGGFDDDFFAHMEEIDFCWRLKNHGYRVMYCPDSTVFHIGGGTLPKASYQKTYLNFRNNFFLLYKNLPSDRLLRVFAVRYLLDTIAAFKFLFQAGFRDFWAVTRAHMSFYRLFGKIKQKRKALQQGSMKDMYRGNIVLEYYLLGRRKYTQLNSSRFFSK